MNEMVERVARTIAKEMGSDPDRWRVDGFGYPALCAIEAMREPTDAMLRAAATTPTWGYPPFPPEAVPDLDYIEDFDRAYRAMIAAALK